MLLLSSSSFLLFDCTIINCSILLVIIETAEWVAVAAHR